MPEVAGSDCRDDGDVRFNHLHERRDLAGMVHANLENREFCASRHARQGQGNTPVVVVGSRRSMGFPLAAKRKPKRFLRARFAHAPRHRDHLRTTSLARRDAEAPQRRERIVDDEE